MSTASHRGNCQARGPRGRWPSVPLKPVGLVDPRTGKRPYAVVQLRREDADGQLQSGGLPNQFDVGAQKRIFRLIPGLEKAEFVRFMASCIENTFIDAPKVLVANFRLRDFPGLYIAGQLAGVEGYTGICGFGAGCRPGFVEPGCRARLWFPRETLLGSLTDYVTRPNPDFQPMNANFGLLPPVPGKTKPNADRTTLSVHWPVSMFTKNLND